MLKEKKYSLLIFFLAFLFMLGELSYSQTTFWEKTADLVNIKITAMVQTLDGTIVIGTDASGVYKSTDNGNSWSELNNGLKNKSIKSLLINSKGQIFACTFSGIFKINDFSSSWTQVNSGLTNLYVNAIAINSDDEIFIGTSGSGVFKSSDDGSTWINVSNGLKILYVYSLAINQNGHIYAGAIGMFKSTDDGASWIDINNSQDVNNNFPTTYVFAIAIDSSGNLYTGTNVDGVLMSTNEGLSWSKVNSGLTKYDVRSIIINPNKQIFVGTKGGGVFRSLNDGENWAAVNDGLTNLEVQSFIYKNSGYLFAGTSSGVFRSALPVQTPDVYTDQASLVTDNSATLNGRINPNSILTTAKFQYGMTTDYGIEVIGFPSVITGSNLTNVTANLTSLRSNTTYHFRLVGTNTLGTYFGADQTFSTIDVPPIINITPTSLNFTADKNGSLPASQHFNISKTGAASLTWSVIDDKTWIDVSPKNGVDTGTIIVSINSTNLDPGTYTGQITVSSLRAQNSPQVVNLSYTVLDKPVIGLSPINIGFDTVFIKNSKQQKVVISNKGTISLKISDIKISGTDSTSFNYSISKNLPFTIDPGYTDSVIIKFAPSSPGSKSATLNIYHNAGIGISSVSLSGVCIRPFLTPPQLIKPADTTKDVSSSIILIWNPVVNVTSYNCQISIDSTFTTIFKEAKNLGSTSYAVTDLQNNSTYFWRVSSNDTLGAGIWSIFWRFRTIQTVPDGPKLIYPVNKITGVSINPVLSWNTINNVLFYTVQVSPSNTFSPNVFDQSNLNSPSCLVKDLQNSTNYYWRVSATNSIGTGKWSDTFSFTTIGTVSKFISLTKDNLNCVLNSYLSDTLKIRVTDAAGNPVPNVRTVFDFSQVPFGSAGYLLSNYDTRTDLKGESFTLLKVGAKPGLYVVSAKVPEYTLNPIYFNITANSGAASNILLFSGDGQQNEINTVALDALVISVIDSAGNPIEKAKVKFKITDVPYGAIGQTIISDSLTNADGEASATFKFGNLTGKYKVTVTSDQLPNISVAFSLTATIPQYSNVISVNGTIAAFPKYQKISDYKNTDWRIIGLPGASNHLINEYLTGNQNDDWQVYWDNGASSNYMIKFDGSSTFADSVGKAFWVLSKNDLVINKFIPAAPLNPNQEVEIPLRPGWNLITNPFTTSVSWSKIQSYNNTGTPLFTFNGQWDTSANFVPLSGYLIDNVDKLSILRIPYNLLFSSMPNKISKGSSGWKVNVSFNSENYTDKTLWFGVTSGKILNIKKPRTMAEMPMTYFFKPEWDTCFSFYSTDIRTESNSLMIWDFNIQSNIGTQNKLFFEGLDDIPDNFKILLVDESSFKYGDLRADSTYSFISKSQVSKFKILVGEAKDISSQIQALILPTEYSLDNCYPNPFNPTTTIPITIPKVGNVKLTIYDALGREVKTIYNGYLDIGKYLFQWNGTDVNGHHVSSGIYIYRLITPGGINLSKRMIMMK